MIRFKQAHPVVTAHHHERMVALFKRQKQPKIDEATPYHDVKHLAFVLTNNKKNYYSCTTTTTTTTHENNIALFDTQV